MNNNILNDLNSKIDSIIEKYVSEFKSQDSEIDNYLASRKNQIDGEFANAMTNSSHLAIQSGHSEEDDFVKNLLSAKDRGFLELIRKLKQEEKKH